MSNPADQNVSTLVLGASSDLGMEFIRSCTCRRIVAHYRSGDGTAIRNLSEKEKTIEVVKADLGSKKDIEFLLSETERLVGCPSSIVHLAMPRLALIRFRDCKLSDFKDNLDVGLMSAVVTLNRFVPVMAKRRFGKVVIMLSSNVIGTPAKCQSPYTVTKYAQLGLVRSLACEYGPAGININGISPSLIETKFLINMNEKIVELAAHQHPLKRNASVSEIVPMIHYLLSEQASFINGANIPITGGES